MEMAQSKVSDQVGASVLAKSLQGMREQGADLERLLSSAAPLPEGSGQNVDSFA